MSGLDVGQLGELVIRPTLALLAEAAPGIDGPVAELLLLATAAQESQFRYLKQVKGPALGLWQMEPATHKDLIRWLYEEEHGKNRPEFYEVVGGLTRNRGLDSELVGNLGYACAMARLLYWRDPEPLPTPEELGAGPAHALWPTYKRVWNTEAGAATVSQFVLNYLGLVATHWPPAKERA